MNMHIISSVVFMNMHIISSVVFMNMHLQLAFVMMASTTNIAALCMTSSLVWSFKYFTIGSEIALSNSCLRTGASFLLGKYGRKQIYEGVYKIFT